MEKKQMKLKHEKHNYDELTLSLLRKSLLPLSEEKDLKDLKQIARERRSIRRWVRILKG